MHNLDTLTDFIRRMAGEGMGFSAFYLVPKGKSYESTCKSLTATAHREGVSISTSKILVVDPSRISTWEAVKVTVK